LTQGATEPKLGSERKRWFFLMKQQELLKGNTDTLLLALLQEESMYGYQIVKEVNQRSSGYFAFKEGTLYPALHRLERARLIEGRWEDTPNGVRRRYYFITEHGRQELTDRQREWQRFSRAMNSVMLSGT
jgi:PadR family transcriptional regulator PadR